MSRTLDHMQSNTHANEVEQKKYTSYAQKIYPYNDELNNDHRTTHPDII